MADDWYGHRDAFTFEPKGDKDEWLEWDYLLLGAFQTIEDYSDQYGLLAWELADDAVYVDAVRRVHKFEQARDMVTRGTKTKPYQAVPGEYFIPKIGTQRSDGKIQTFREWIETPVGDESD